MNAIDVRHKHGDTFVFQTTCTDAAGAAVDITGFVITCQLRDRQDVLIAYIAIQIDDGPAGRHSSVPMASDAWPVGKPLHLDVRYAVNGTVVHSETITVLIEYAVTRP